MVFSKLKTFVNITVSNIYIWNDQLTWLRIGLHTYSYFMPGIQQYVLCVCWSITL